MVEVELDQTDDWGTNQDWQQLSEKAIKQAFQAADFAVPPGTSISISLSDNDEVRALNAQWRGKDRPTNVLSFPMLAEKELNRLNQPRHPEFISGSILPQKPDAEIAEWMLKHVQHDGAMSEVLLGDLILAYDICAAEAKEKGIPLSQHVTHLIIHGTLHLLGYDHIDDEKAEHMEALEVKALASLGLPNPYNDE
jgi:probable rRNA maturation factor